MILLVSTRADPHGDMVVSRLQSAGATFVRLNWDDFPARVRLRVGFEFGAVDGRIDLPLGRTAQLDGVSAVWCRGAPRATVAASIAPVAARRLAYRDSVAALRGFLSLLAPRIWMNEPSRVETAQLKLLQLGIAQRLGFEVPRTVVANDDREVSQFLSTLSGRAVAKTLGYPELEADGLALFTSLIDADDLQDAASLELAPTLVQEAVPKRVEWRVTVVGPEVYCLAIDVGALGEAGVDWRRAPFKVLAASASVVEMPTVEADRCCRYLDYFGLTYGAFDFIVTPDDRLVFLELNPHGAWGFVEQIAHLPISEAIARALMSADHDKASGAT